MPFEVRDTVTISNAAYADIALGVGVIEKLVEAEDESTRYVVVIGDDRDWFGTHPESDLTAAADNPELESTPCADALAAFVSAWE